MPMNILFWVIYLLAALITVWSYYDRTPNSGWYRRAGGSFVLWILVGIIGWSVFGPAVK